jgi:hypothetical protein
MKLSRKPEAVRLCGWSGGGSVCHRVSVCPYSLHNPRRTMSLAPIF